MKKKLIEVALPLDSINKASAREKSIRHGHPSTLHLWWARRPLAAARAVIFAQMVDDPSAHPDLFPTEKAQEKERQRLFRIIEELVQWESTTDPKMLQSARDEIWQSWRRACAENVDHPRARELFDRYRLPGFHDPFAGGGTLPLEAQRLGLESHATDLNPVAVLINKAMIEVPPRFAGTAPVNPQSREKLAQTGSWAGAQGLAEDVLQYGLWLRDEAEKRIGHLYPRVSVTPELAKRRTDLKPYVNSRLTVIAWLWARTVRSPNPAFSSVEVPLAATFTLATKPGKEWHIEPVVDGATYRFTVKAGKTKAAEAARAGTKLERANFRCLMSGAPITGEYIKAEAKAGRMGARLMAVVAEGDRGRVYLEPTPEMEAAAGEAAPEWKPDVEFFEQALGFRVGNYGMTRWSDLFTQRQLVALDTFTSLVREVRELVTSDALNAGMPADGKSFADGGNGASAYADAVATYLALAVSRYANAASTLCTWNPGAKKEDIRFTFSRQALPMTWDFAEGNPFSESSGNLSDSVETWVYKALTFLPAGGPSGSSLQADAATQEVSAGKVISTDPPYYDNIGYADLSDFFYVWLRQSLRPVYPDIFGTVAVPKAEELVATPDRHGGKDEAEKFFLDGMTEAMHRLAERAHPGFPVTIYYAFKQAETDDEGTASTGWETFLAAVIRAGFMVCGTWPIRTEREGRTRDVESNALASSVVLVCRPRQKDAAATTRREFVAALRAELPVALAHLQRGNIAPVDLAQAAIGPGMAVYTRYERVLEADGKPLSVRDALTLINETLDEALAEQEGDFDADSRWAVAWFGDNGFADGPFGDAHTYFLRFNTAENALVAAGIIRSGRGKVRLLRPDELPSDWDPDNDPRLTAWETVHHLIRVLEAGGENAASALVAKLGAKADAARELAYRLYTLCERKKRAAEAMAYNALVQSWPEITRLAREGGRAPVRKQADLFGTDEE